MPGLLTTLKRAWDALDARAPIDNRTVLTDPAEARALVGGQTGMVVYQDGKPTDEPATLSHSWAYSNSPWVMACVRKIAVSGASVPLVWRDRDTDDPIDEGDVPKLFRYVNDRSSQAMLVHHALASNSLHGNVIWWLDRGPTERAVPLNIWPLMPDQVEIARDEHTGEITYRYGARMSLSPKGYRPEDIFHAPNYSPSNDTWGMSDVESLGVTINADRQAALTNLNFLLHGATPSYAVIVEGETPMTTEQKAELRRQWESLHGGAANAGRAIIMGGRKYTLVPLGTTPRDAQYQELRVMNREEICAAFDVPPPMVGILERANYANMRECRKSLWSDSVKPRLDRLSGAINESGERFGFDPDVMYCDFDTSGVEALQPDLMTQAQAGSMLAGSGLWTADEVRDRIWSMAPKQKAEPEEPKEPKEPNESVAAEQTPPPAEAEAAEKTRARPPMMLRLQRKARGAHDDDWRQARWADVEEIQNRWRKRIGDRVSVVFGLLNEDVLNRIAHETKSLRTKSVPVPDILLFDLDAAGELLVRELGPLEWEALLATGQEIVTLFDLGTEFLESTPRTAQIATERNLVIKTIPETYHDELRTRIARSFEEGLPMSELQEVVDGFYRETYGAWNRHGAARIARTETNSIYNAAAMESYAQNDIEKHEWVHSFMAAAPRPEHVAAHGEVVTVGEPFSTGLAYPMDWANGGPGDNINCGCQTMPVVD